MTVLDKIKAFFKRLKPEAEGAEKLVTEPLEMKAPEKKGGQIVKSKRGKK